MSSKDIHILLVENEEAHAELVRRAFDSYNNGGFHLTVACDLGEARRRLSEFVPDLVIVDLLLPDGQGTELLPGANKEPLYPVVVITSHGDERTAVEAIKGGALDYVVKSESALSDMPRVAERSLRAWGYITKRRRAEKMLRESEEQYRAIFKQAADSIVLFDAETGQLTRFNDRAHQSLGYTRDEFTKLKIPDFEVVESAEEVFAHTRKIVKEGADTFETRHKTKTGEIHNILVSARAISIGGKDFVQAIWRDITERKQAEQKLLEYQAQLKSLASELSLTEERERRRLAAGLHDNIGQSLALTKLAVQSLMESVSDSNMLASLDEICTSIDKTIQDAHCLTFELSNPVLYELGFEAAVEQWLSEQIQEKYAIKCKFNAAGQPFQLDNEISVVLFQAVRELLINIIKHAKAKTVEVSIRKADDRIELVVADDGIGFVPSELSLYSPKNKTGGFGLFSIRERLEYLGGNIAIKSLPAKGTRVTLSAPLNR